MHLLSKLVLAVAIVAMFVPAVAIADYSGGTSGIGRVSGYFSGSGGEFTMNPTLLGNSAYSPKTSDIGSLGSFQTFCVELDERTARVDVIVSTTFIDENPAGTGAVTGPGSHAVLGGKAFGDNLDPTTAYLYTQFATGVLSSYDYDDLTGGRAVSAGQLQNAIWNIEEGLALDATADAQAIKWVDEANNAGWNGIGNVRVLNNYEAGHVGDLDYKKQDQLYLVPVPAAVMMGLPLLALLGGFRFLRRRTA